MTLGIGVMCERGDCVVMASEQRATYGNTGNTSIDPNDECGKQYQLRPLKIFVNVAGSMSTCHAVFSQIAHEIDALGEKPDVFPELLMKIIDAARLREIRRIYDWEIKRSMGISLSELAKGKLPSGKMHKLIVRAGLHILKQAPFNAALIVGGFCGSHGLFFRASQKEIIQEETSPAVYAIGNGQVAAMRQLNKRGQNIHMSLPRTLLHVYEAMHVAQSKYVGPPPKAVAVIRKHEDRVMLYPLRSLEGWRKTYESRQSTAGLDDSSLAGKEVLFRLKVLGDSDKRFRAARHA